MGGGKDAAYRWALGHNGDVWRLNVLLDGDTVDDVGLLSFCWSDSRDSLSTFEYDNRHLLCQAFCCSSGSTSILVDLDWDGRAWLTDGTFVSIVDWEHQTG